MALGRPLDKSALDNGVASIANAFFAMMDNADKYKLVLDGLSVSNLEAMGYTTTEASQLKSAFTDLANLTTIWRGGAATGTMPRDHRAFIKFALGNGLY